MNKNNVVLGLTICISMAMLIIGCSFHQYSNDEIVGTWVSPKGGTLIFDKQDGAQGISIPRYVIISETWKPSNDPCSGKGNWNIENNEIRLTFKPVTDDKDGHIVEVDISDQLEIKGTGASMCIYYILGDPDSMNYYEFYRKAP